MALSSSALSTAIRDKLVAREWCVDGEELTELCDDIAAAVVEHLTTAGVINTVTTCPAGAGTGVGTIS